MNEKRKERTLRDALAAINTLNQDRDVSVDGIGDSIAVVAPVRLTPEGKEYFGEALDLPFEEGCVVSHDDADYDAIDEYEEGNEKSFGKLQLAWELLVSLAGYCPCSDFERWFEGDTAEEI